MAIFGIGAYYGKDMSQKFIDASIVGIGWSESEAPDLHQYLRMLKPGDIVYIKAYPPGGDLIIKAVGLIMDDLVVTSSASKGLVNFGRNVSWVSTDSFTLTIPQQKNNVRSNTIYEEYHPEIQKEILKRVLG